MSLQVRAVPPDTQAAALEISARGNMSLRLAALVCGASSAFGLDLLGELFWAELLLPILGIGIAVFSQPRDLFANRAFQTMMLGIVAMLLGYMLSDIAAGTPREMYLRGWARVAVLGTSAFSLCVLCHRDPRALWCFCVGMGIGGIAANALAGIALTHWKLGYGEPVAYLAAASGAWLPLWMASIVIVLVGGMTVLLDYRSLGSHLMLAAAATFLRHRNIGLDQLRKNLPLLLLGFGAVAFAAIYLLNASQGENMARREVSNISRFAALQVGTQAIMDSPIIGYGSWGQGTKKYADMLYEATLGDLLSVGDDSIVGNPERGSYFSAHSQIIQAWMEGGILAGAFFIAYIVLLTRGLYQLTFKRPADYLTPLLLLIIGSNLWAAVMSPFLGNQRITVALTIAGIVLLSTERTTLGASIRNSTSPITVSRRPANLMQ